MKPGSETARGRGRTWAVLLCVLLGLVCVGCGDSSSGGHSDRCDGGCSRNGDSGREQPGTSGWDRPAGHSMAWRDVTDSAGALAEVRTTVPANWGTTDMYSGGVLFRDLNGDDIPDLFLARTSESDPDAQGTVLLEGQPDGTFENVTTEAGVDYGGPAVGVAAADFDGNGRIDLYVSTDRAGDRLFFQEGPLEFDERGDEAGIRGDSRPSRSVALLDYDGDGWLDIYVTAWDGQSDAGWQGGQMSWTAPNVLYRNRGDGTFEDVTEETGVDCDGRSSLGAGAADLDADGDTDLYVANDFFDDCLYENLGDGRFEEVSQQANVGPDAISGMGVAFGDPDADLDLDILVTDDLRADRSPGNAYYRNKGGLEFASEALELGLDGGGSVDQSGAVYWGTAWRDFDNNGWVEPHLGQHSTGPDYMFHWEPQGARFVPVAKEIFRPAHDVRGTAYADYDRDGRVDLVLMARGGSPRLFHNEGGADHHWLRIRAVGPEGNRSAIGGRVHVHACERSVAYPIVAGTGYLSASEPIVHAGLGECTEADRVRVMFPGGEERTLEDVAADQRITVRRGE